MYSIPDQYENLDVLACAVGHYSLELEVSALREYDDNTGPCVHGCLAPDWSRLVKLAGPLIAYAVNQEEDTKYGPCYCSSWTVIVRNLRTGHFVHRIPTGPHHGNSAEDNYVGVGPTFSIVAKSDGAVAWIAENRITWLERFRTGQKEPSSYEVHVDDHAGVRVLAAGRDVGPRSLTLAGSTLHWTQAGKRFSARLN